MNQIVCAFTNAEKFINRVTYKENYSFIVGCERDSPFIQVRCYRPDAITGEPGYGYGGKGYFNESTTESQFARLLFGLIKAYEEHETREFFKIDGIAVFGPHIHINALLEAGSRLEHLEVVG